ncbi:hypothetical protein LguiA_013785 [Lonicera macranthoides]
MYLINPLNGIQIKLPPRTKFPDVKNYRASKLGNEYGLLSRKGNAIEFGDSTYVNVHSMEKIVLSSPPSHENCMVVAIYGEFLRLAYCKYRGLIMVARHIDCHAIEAEKGHAYNTSGFKVYKHEPSNSSWSLVKNIGVDMLFLGFNSSFSILSSSCPFPCYKDNKRGGDIGVFNLEDESIESLL